MYKEPDPHTGFISWFARNPVAANLLMIMIIAVGGLAFITMTKEAQPRIPPRGINVTIPFPGAAPEEVCLLYTSPSPRDATLSRMPSSA